ncbi:hypothetical protein AB0M43_03695 [Longispora sp. NPDC051575]|uniref:hypothetical protein n=1 Tax=Longispora sp. NPDC051575 TaxID=3154943 RepID=UPI003430CCCA
MSVVSRVVTRSSDGRILGFDVSRPAREDAVLVPDVTFAVPDGDEPQGPSVAPDLGAAVYATADAVVCLAPDGGPVWRLDLGTGPATHHTAWSTCRYSPDGATVWVYLPDIMAGRGDTDRWLVLDARSGAVLARADLDTTGQGGHQVPDPDGVHMLLDVGEGQDGTVVYRGRLDGGTLALTEYPWSDRVLTGLAPDGRRGMTVDHSQQDVAFHAHPGGEVLVVVTVAELGDEEAAMEWSGGYLDPATAVVTLVGETGDGEDWHRHALLDPGTGAVLGDLAAGSRDPYDLELVGDGSWLTTDADGRVWRRVRRA